MRRYAHSNKIVSLICFVFLFAGDALLSINGRSVEDWSHEALIQTLRKCNIILRLVVLYEESTEQVEAALRLRKLKVGFV